MGGDEVPVDPIGRLLPPADPKDAVVVDPRVPVVLDLVEEDLREPAARGTAGEPLLEKATVVAPLKSLVETGRDPTGLGQPHRTVPPHPVEDLPEGGLHLTPASSITPVGGLGGEPLRHPLGTVEIVGVMGQEVEIVSRFPQDVEQPTMPIPTSRHEVSQTGTGDQGIRIRRPDGCGRRPQDALDVLEAAPGPEPAQVGLVPDLPGVDVVPVALRGPVAEVRPVADVAGHARDLRAIGGPGGGVGNHHQHVEIAGAGGFDDVVVDLPIGEPRLGLDERPDEVDANPCDPRLRHLVEDER
jgi:hypothetical protein